MAGEKILILDSDEGYRTTLAWAFEDTDYEIQCANSVVDGIEKVAIANYNRSPFNLFISSVELEKDQGQREYGYDFYNSIPTNREVPIIFMTKFIDNQGDWKEENKPLEEKVKACKPTAILQKGFDPDELYAAVEKALGHDTSNP